jgi:hypothetical protein
MTQMASARQTPNRVRSGKCNEKQEADTAEP